MVSLGKVTVPKPMNLPSQRCARAGGTMPFNHACVVPLSLSSGAFHQHLTEFVATCRRENNGFDPNVSIVPKYVLQIVRFLRRNTLRL